MSTRVIDIKAREKAATEAAWVNGYLLGESSRAAEQANRDFIAHAREDIPYLLAQLEARDKTIAAVEKASIFHKRMWSGKCTPGCHRCEIDRILKGSE